MKHYGHMVRVLNCAISQSLSAALAEMELTSAQGRIMGYIAMTPEPPCAKDVEEKFHLSHPTVSGLLARLEKKGFIEFRPDEKDKRCKRIFMLPKGADCNERIYHVIQENEKKLVTGFSEAEKQQFSDLLTRAANNLGCDPQFHMDNNKEESE